MAITSHQLRATSDLVHGMQWSQHAAKTYRDLEAWQAGMTLVEASYRVTRGFPNDERFGLSAQLRRAAVSVPSNVAEGACRRSIAAFANHVSIAIGSHAEVETCLEIARRLGYVSAVAMNQIMVRVDRTGQLLNGLRRSLVAKIH
jgi:four helix bundle protein